MQSTLSALAIVLTLSSQGDPIAKKELDYQKEAYKQWWGSDLVLTIGDLPLEGKVPGFRVPYAGHDYPDKAGGTLQAMRKYDMAYHRGQSLATEYERRDVGAHRSGRFDDDFAPRRGLFGFGRFRGPRTPSWYGHCNGWTAAAIRHAEPQNSVTRNGVVFTPADIKGMLAEIYMYTDTEFLGGEDAAINPGIFHLSLTNWLGRGDHPVGMETAIGEVVINYPIYTYGSAVTKLSDRQSEVKMSIRYRMNTPQEHNKGPDANQTMYFHYALDTNDKGEITGGRYYGDSARIDMLWAPLQPVQGGKKGNERGNPHLNVKEVLAIWRDSVSEETRNKWLNIDPTEEDRILTEEDKAKLAAEKEAAEKAAADKAAAKKAERETTAATGSDSGSPNPATPPRPLPDETDDQ
jgi:transglutaminase elicitor